MESEHTLLSKAFELRSISLSFTLIPRLKTKALELRRYELVVKTDQGVSHPNAKTSHIVSSLNNNNTTGQHIQYPPQEEQHNGTTLDLIGCKSW